MTYNFEEFVEDVKYVAKEYREEILDQQIQLLKLGQQFSGTETCSEEEYRTIMSKKIPEMDLFTANLISWASCNPAFRDAYRQLADGTADFDILFKPAL